MDHQGQPPFPEPTEITQGSQFLAYLPSSPVSPHRNHRKWWFPVSLCLLTGLVPGPPCGPHSDGSQGRPLPITGHCLSTVPGTSRPGLGGMAVPGDRHAPSPFIPGGRSALCSKCVQDRPWVETWPLPIPVMSSYDAIVLHTPAPSSTGQSGLKNECTCLPNHMEGT